MRIAQLLARSNPKSKSEDSKSQVLDGAVSTHWIVTQRLVVLICLIGALPAPRYADIFQ